MSNKENYKRFRDFSIGNVHFGSNFLFFICWYTPIPHFKISTESNISCDKYVFLISYFFYSFPCQHIPIPNTLFFFFFLHRYLKVNDLWPRFFFLRLHLQFTDCLPWEQKFFFVWSVSKPLESCDKNIVFVFVILLNG